MLLHSLVLAWSHARLCDEFMQWGYDLESFVKELPDDSSRAGMLTQFAEERIAEWMRSGDWGGWEACHHQFPDSAKGLRCLCGGVRKLARADFVVTFLANPDMETCCDACGDRLEQGDEIAFCGRKKRLSQQEPGTLISCHVFICNSCVASCSEEDRLERVWEKVKGANGKTSWCAAKPPGKHVSTPDPDASQSEDSDSQSADSRSEDPQPVEQVPVLAQHSAGDSAPAPASEQAPLSLVLQRGVS